MRLCSPALTVKDKSRVFSWRQKDASVSERSCSGAGREFHVDGPTTAKLRGTVVCHPCGSNNQITMYSEA